MRNKAKMEFVMSVFTSMITLVSYLLMVTSSEGLALSSVIYALSYTIDCVKALATEKQNTNAIMIIVNWIVLLTSVTIVILGVLSMQGTIKCDIIIIILITVHFIRNIAYIVYYYKQS